MDFDTSQALHLVMAALVGATMVAEFAYYMHKKTLDQLLEYRQRIDEEETEEEGDNKPANGKRRRHQNGQKLGQEAARKFHYSVSVSTAHVGLTFCGGAI